jgi:hypothetical protein
MQFVLYTIGASVKCLHENSKMAFQKNIYQKVLPVTVLLLFTAMVIAQKTVRYDLYISDTTVNYT